MMTVEEAIEQGYKLLTKCRPWPGGPPFPRVLEALLEWVESERKELTLQVNSLEASLGRYQDESVEARAALDRAEQSAGEVGAAIERLRTAYKEAREVYGY